MANPSTDFAVSGRDDLAKGNDRSSCCRYGINGLGTLGYDCAIIPGAKMVVSPSPLLSRFCGRDNGLNGGISTICSEFIILSSNLNIFLLFMSFYFSSKCALYGEIQ